MVTPSASAPAWSTSESRVSTMIAVMTRKPPPTVMADARPRVWPRATSQSTTGPTVAAMTTARTSGTTTSGTTESTATASAMSANAMSRRQLHWATRSSQAGTRPGSGGGESGSTMATVADANGQEDRGHRYRREQADDAGELEAGGQHEEHRAPDGSSTVRP